MTINIDKISNVLENCVKKSLTSHAEIMTQVSQKNGDASFKINGWTLFL